MNAKGEYDLETGYKFAEDSRNGDDNRVTKGKKFADLCSKSKFNVTILQFVMGFFFYFFTKL